MLQRAVRLLKPGLFGELHRKWAEWGGPRTDTDAYYVMLQCACDTMADVVATLGAKKGQAPWESFHKLNQWALRNPGRQRQISADTWSVDLYQKVTKNIPIAPGSGPLSPDKDIRTTLVLHGPNTGSRVVAARASEVLW